MDVHLNSYNGNAILLFVLARKLHNKLFLKENSAIAEPLGESRAVVALILNS